MRLVEIRLLEGPNVYRLRPVVKVEVALGRRRAWQGARMPATRAAGGLGRAVPARAWPDAVVDIVTWTRRLRQEHGEHEGPVSVHRASDPGGWVVAWPWAGAERARLIAEAAVDLAARNVSPLRRVRLTNTQARRVERWDERIRTAGTAPPAWVRDAERRMPVISVSGTNGKSTVTRLVTHILLRAGRRVGTTTSDGILVDERLVEAGDWTGPGGAAMVLGRGDLDVAVLETARGGIVLRGVGYESNEASVLTNISADHLDVQGIHTLPELLEVKATIARITRPDGWVVLNADDPLVRTVARRVRARIALFSMDPDACAAVRRHRAAGGRAYGVRAGRLLELEGADERPIAEVIDIPIALAGLARHNVANALAAAAGARAMGASLAEVADGLKDFRPSAELSPGRLNLYRLGSRVIVIDFAHNEAGTEAILAVASGLAGGAAGRTTPITAIIGTAGDRPDDTLRGIGRVAARHAQRIAIKETLVYLRGRNRGDIIAALRAGIAEGGGDPDRVPVYETEAQALESELAGAGAQAAGGGRADAARIVVLLCHEQREEVGRLLDRLGARPIADAPDLLAVAPRLTDRHRPPER